MEKVVQQILAQMNANAKANQEDMLKRMEADKEDLMTRMKTEIETTKRKCWQE
jgi:F0F1-type ATP synthase membrane subunit b/b'